MVEDAEQELPIVAQKSPIVIDVEAGVKYFWCTCGKSTKQPFCDGSHKGSDFRPLIWEADLDGKKFFCGCKMTAGKPFCDGTHSKL